MNDRKTVLTVVYILGAVAVICVAGLIYLIGADKPAESLLPVVGLGTGALGGLTGILAATNSVDVEGLKKLAEEEEKQVPPPMT